MARVRREQTALISDPLWYKDAIIYEVRVGAFQDSGDDGIGDFRGLTQRLDYLQDLGITAIWLLPFYPSPKRDDGYDIADYCAVDPEAGTLDDFKAFLRGAHQRGLRVITELVINHTSEQHPWFQRARRAPANSRERAYYVWSDTPERYREARIIFKDFERSNWTWDPVAQSYYWHRFYSHQPDLNFASPEVRAEVFRVVDFWLTIGVDGLRLDAIPYLFEHEGTGCENLPETHEWLRQLRAHVDTHFADRMLLAEANQWPEDAVTYFGNGDECHMAFNFPAMPRLFMALHMEDRFPVIDILQQTPPTPPTCQWALFLRNHDELTLEMVTDEERDYMYRVYAHDTQARLNLGIRRRLAPLLGKDRRRIELMNALLLSLPGSPVIYYGDEIGMGDNVYLGDRNGVRTPMQWSADRNAGFSRANPQRLYLPIIVDPEYHYETTNVEAQQGNRHSLLWWMKRVIGLRKRFAAFGRGTIRFLSPVNRRVLAFVREHEQQRILVVANLSRFVQHVALDLSDYRDRILIEMFGRTEFPHIGDQPYVMMLGPHSFYWFALENPRQAGADVAQPPSQPPLVSVRRDWRDVFQDSNRDALADGIRRFLGDTSWLGKVAQRIRGCAVEDVIELDETAGGVALVVVRVQLEGSDSEWLLVPVQFVDASATASDQRVVVEIVVDGREQERHGRLIEASHSAVIGSVLFEVARQRRVVHGHAGELVPVDTVATHGAPPERSEPWEATSAGLEAGGSCFVAADQLRLKLYRRLHEGVNPSVEMGCALSNAAGDVPIAPLLQVLEYRGLTHEPITLAVIHSQVHNEGDLWSYTLNHLKHYFDHALTGGRTLSPAEVPEVRVALLIEQEPPTLILEMIGAYLETARLLGQRVGQLHQALAAIVDDPDFAPEPVTVLYQRSLYQSLRNLLATVSFTVRDRLAELPLEIRPGLERLLSIEPQLLALCQRIVNVSLNGTRIRCHTDLHLGRVLHTGKDLVFVGLEGDRSRSLSERRRKRSPLHDVATILRSFEFAVERVLYGPAGSGVIRPADVPSLVPWAHFWSRWVGSAFLRAYVHGIAGKGLVPESLDPLERLLTVHLIERSLATLTWALKDEPSYAAIPLRGLLELVEVR